MSIQIIENRAGVARGAIADSGMSALKSTRVQVECV